MKSNNYIGGEFSSADLPGILLHDRSASAARYFPRQIGRLKRSFFESGADSIAFILSNKKESALVLWVPENFCHESLDRVQLKLPEKEIIIRKYSSLAKIQQDNGRLNLALIVHFNSYNHQDLTNGLDLPDIDIIEDFTHAPLDITKSKANHSFSSLRKFIPASVSVTYSNEVSGVKSGGHESAYLKMKKTASEIKALTREDPKYGEESVYLELFELAEAQLSNCQIQIAHPGQTKIFERIDFRKLHKIRVSNYEFLNQTLQHSNAISGVLPGHYMFFTVVTNHQQQLRRHFFDHGIFPAILWKESDSPLSKKILSFHIDHRYNTKDMERIKKVMEAFSMA